MKSKTQEVEYLGDAVYASFDGYHIWLQTWRETGSHRIALEPAVMQALTAYAESVWPKRGVDRNG